TRLKLDPSPKPLYPLLLVFLSSSVQSQFPHAFIRSSPPRKENPKPRRGALHPFLAGEAAVDGRGGAVEQNSCTHDGGLCRSGSRRAGDRAGSGHRTGDRGFGG